VRKSGESVATPGGATELLSTSAGLGEAQNDDPRWQPRRPRSVQRGKHGKKREDGQGKREGKEGGRVGVQVRL
jgi:hypothetical protein